MYDLSMIMDTYPTTQGSNLRCFCHSRDLRFCDSPHDVLLPAKEQSGYEFLYVRCFNECFLKFLNILLLARLPSFLI